MILFLYIQAKTASKEAVFACLHHALFCYTVSMNLEWAKKRKIIYGSLALITVILVCIYAFRDVLFPTPTCFDGKQNGFETGLDCGGACSLRCTQDVIPLIVSWARALPTSSSTYDFAAVITNKNIDNAPRDVAYTFTAYNREGKELYKVDGTTIVPIDGDFPVVAQNIALPEAPHEVSAVVASNVPHYTVLEKPTTPTIRVVGTRYEAGSIPRVYATLINTKRLSFVNLPVRVLLYDAEGNVYAAGQTIVPALGKEGTREIVFTWDRAFPVAPTQIRVFPILDPFLGSL